MVFGRDIRPILSDHCYQCHGPDADSREADLRLDLESSAKAVLNDHAPIVPGDSAASELVQRIKHRDPDKRMPPPEANKELSPEQIGLLEQWIENGAQWSLPWSYIPPAWHPIPRVAAPDWIAELDRSIHSFAT